MTVQLSRPWSLLALHGHHTSSESVQGHEKSVKIYISLGRKLMSRLNPRPPSHSSNALYALPTKEWIRRHPLDFLPFKCQDHCCV